MYITIRVIIGDYCSKSDSKEEDRGSGTVVCAACRRNYPESDRLSTRRSKTQYHYHCSSLVCLEE